MIKLIRLELQRMNLRTYFIASAVFGAAILVFTYFAACVAKVEHEVQFMNYKNIFLLSNAVSIILFGILAATMYSRLVMGGYSEKRLALLFSYPGSRKKIFAAKMAVVFFFVIISMLVCTGVPVMIFAAAESFLPIVPDVLTPEVLWGFFKVTVVSLVYVNAAGLLAVWIGFLSKSFPVTLISAFVLSGVYGDFIVKARGDGTVSFLLLGASLIVILFVFVALANRINHIEVG